MKWKCLRISEFAVRKGKCVESTAYIGNPDLISIVLLSRKIQKTLTSTPKLCTTEIWTWFIEKWCELNMSAYYYFSNICRVSHHGKRLWRAANYAFWSTASLSQWLLCSLRSLPDTVHIQSNITSQSWGLETWWVFKMRECGSMSSSKIHGWMESWHK